MLVPREPLATPSQVEPAFLRPVLLPTHVLSPSPASLVSAESAVMPPPVVSMLLVMPTLTSASVRKVLLEMATSCVCLQSYQPSVHQDVEPTVTVSTTFPTSASVTLASVVTHMKAAPPAL